MAEFSVFLGVGSGNLGMSQLGVQANYMIDSLTFH